MNDDWDDKDYVVLELVYPRNESEDYHNREGNLNPRAAQALRDTCLRYFT